MYEYPKLVQVGRAEDVILGVASFGDDLDGHVVVPDFEFGDDWLCDPFSD